MNFQKITFSTNSLQILEQDDDVMIVSLRLLHTGRNVNMCNLPKEGVEKSIPTFWNKPIIYKFNCEYFPVDVDDHNNDKENGTMNIAGSIIESGGFKWVEEDGYEYLEFIGVIHKIYQPILVDIIKDREGKLKVSIEIKPIKASEDDDGYLVVEQFKLLSVCLLGKKYREGIENSELNVVKFSAKEYNDKYKKFSEDFKMKKGTKPPIKLNKSKDKVSFDEWGSVDKTELRNKVLEAKNYKTLIKSVYLKVLDGWETAPSEKLKYPVMQIKNGELVYNRYAISSALGYAKGEDEQEVVTKANSLLDKLEIKEDDSVENEKIDNALDKEEEVIENSVEEEKIDNALDKEEEKKEVVEDEKDDDDEDEDEKIDNALEEDKIDYKAKFEELEMKCNALEEEVKTYKRKEEVEVMKNTLQKFSHCFSEADKKVLMDTIETFSFESFQAKVDEQIKNFALSQAKQEERVVNNTQTFSNGIKEITPEITEKKFDIYEYGGVK